MLKVIGLKKLMTQVFTESGDVVPVTVIDLNDCVVAKKSEDAVWIGFGKKNSAIKSEVGNYKELGYVPVKVLRQSKNSLSEKNIGDKLDSEIFANIEFVDITGKSKGKGFAGVVKRWGFHGGPKTHGQSDRNRAPGSIGSGTTPGRVYKGKKMGGRLGGDNITIKNLKVIRFDNENNLLMVKGAVPGMNNSLVVININK